MDLVRSVLAGELNLALVTAPPKMLGLRRYHLSGNRSTPYFLKTTVLRKERLSLRDLADDEWILFAEQVHPIVRNVILETAQREKIDPKEAHDTFTGQAAAHLVSEHLGVAIVTGSAALDLNDKGLVLRPLVINHCVSTRAW